MIQNLYKPLQLVERTNRRKVHTETRLFVRAAAFKSPGAGLIAQCDCLTRTVITLPPGISQALAATAPMR